MLGISLLKGIGPHNAALKNTGRVEPTDGRTNPCGRPERLETPATIDYYI